MNNAADGFYKLECGAIATAGDRVYNYYDMRPGVIEDEAGWDGWFRFRNDDGTTSILDGSRCCSLAFASRRGFRDAA